MENLFISTKNNLKYRNICQGFGPQTSNISHAISCFIPHLPTPISGTNERFNKRYFEFEKNFLNC